MTATERIAAKAAPGGPIAGSIAESGGRYWPNDCSVPTAHAFQKVLVKGFVEEVVILCPGEEVARHLRCYGEGVFVSNPLHYLALLKTKPGALDQTAALQGRGLPEVFQHLRHLLEARMATRQTRVYPGA